MANNSTSVQEMAKDYALYHIGVNIHRYYVPILVPIGQVGNILSVMAMILPHNRDNACCNYIAALSVTDFGMLYVAGHYWVVSSGFFRGIYLYECKMLAWLNHLFSLIAIFFIICLTFNRYIAIRHPFRYPAFFNPKKTRVSIVVIVMVMIAYSWPFILTTGMVDGNTCAAVTAKTTFTTVYSWMNIFLISILPFITLLTMNSLIIRTIRRRSKYFDSNNCTSSESENSKRDLQLTLMLVIVSFAFLILTLPMCIRYILTVILPYTTDPYLYAVYIFVYHLSQKMYFTNHAVNFYLYCICGSKFRQDIRSIFCKKKLQSNSEQASISTVSYTM